VSGQLLRVLLRESEVAVGARIRLRMAAESEVMEE
jgi:hypothetical protein